MEKELWPGWRTVRLLGAGSYGKVYEIERDVVGTTEKAALKVIRIPQDDSEIRGYRSEGYDDATINTQLKSYLDSILNEYALMSRMKGHSCVVYCDDCKYVPNEVGIGWTIYIRMELLTSLMDALPRLSDEREILKLGRDVCSALVRCGELNLIHRDIKPQNIFVSDDGVYKMGDFGIAKIAESTAGGTKIGTYDYMAPEVYHNKPYGPAVDQYSLGMVLYWLLNGRRAPFLSPGEIPAMAMKEEARLRRFGGEPLPPPAHGSEALRKIVLKACAYDPASRYPSAREMLDALEGLIRENLRKETSEHGQVPDPETRPAQKASVEEEKFSESPESAPAPSRPTANGEAAQTPEGEASDDEKTQGLFTGTAASEKKTPQPASGSEAEPEEASEQTVRKKMPVLLAVRDVLSVPEKRKKLLSEKWTWIILTAVLLCVVVFVSLSPGKSWRFHKGTGILTIHMDQAMPDYSKSDKADEGEYNSTAPWNKHRRDIKTVEIDPGVPNISDYAFYGCSNLESVTIPDSVMDIGENAFGYCSSLEHVTIPGSVTSIGSYSFAGCGLKTVSIPASVKTIGKGAFPEGTEIIREQNEEGQDKGPEKPADKAEKPADKAEEPADKAEEPADEAEEPADKAEKPAGETEEPADEAEEQADETEEPAAEAEDPSEGAENTTDETEAPMAGEGWTYDGRGVLTISMNGKMPAYAYDSEGGSAAPWNKIKASVQTVDIKPGVTNISDRAFYNFSALTAVTIPDSVASIGDHAFHGCARLADVTIPGGVKNIGSYAFYKCGSLESVTVPDGATAIGDYAFNRCSNLTEATIPDSVTSVGEKAFPEETEIIGGYNVKEPAEALTVGDGWHFNKDTGVLTVSMQGRMPDYITANAAPWYNIRGKIKRICIQPGATYISQNAFRDCSSLKSMSIPDSVTSIGANAFLSCGMKRVRIPNSVISIGAYAFCGCKSLESVTIPDSVTSIGDHAFHGCARLADVTIPDSVKSIGGNAFYSCESLKSVSIPGSLKRIENEAFALCSSLKRISIPDNVTAIGNKAFLDCSSLERVTIPDSVTSIGSYAFWGCSSLKSVTIPDSVTYIGTDAFPTETEIKRG